ncbi:MAG: ATP-binding protein [Bacteroidales bacterium]|jgi:hypothetical protein|nr:ATP-binding protein [Bacteroidales bacterium]
MILSSDFKQQVREELLSFKSNDYVFSRQHGIDNSVLSKIKKGEITNLISDEQWLNIGKILGITQNKRDWNIARTDVFSIIEEEVMFCKEYSKSRIFIDDCGIGKTFTAKYLSRNIKNCFYIDASQAKTKNRFIRLLAGILGIDNKGSYADIISNIKYYLCVSTKPVIIIDESGDLDYPAFLEIKELWNATENLCGWYMIGAEGLRAKIERGINNKKVGYREIFSRFSEKYSTAIPLGNHERMCFYRKLITDVLSVNIKNKEQIPQIVKKCLIQQNGNIGGLRRAEALLILNQENYGNKEENA